MELITENIKGKKNYKNESNRNYGIDLLRMYSMFSIIILHINVYSGQLTANLKKIFKKFYCFFNDFIT